VLLPDPEGPMIETNSPAATSRLLSLTTGRMPPLGSRNSRVIFFNATWGGRSDVTQNLPLFDVPRDDHPFQELGGEV